MDSYSNDLMGGLMAIGLGLFGLLFGIPFREMMREKFEKPMYKFLGKKYHDNPLWIKMENISQPIIGLLFLIIGIYYLYRSLPLLNLLFRK